MADRFLRDLRHPLMSDITQMADIDNGHMLVSDVTQQQYRCHNTHGYMSNMVLSDITLVHGRQISERLETL